MPEPAPAEPRLYSLLQLVEEACADAERRHEARAHNLPLGPVSGLPRLDRELGGAFTVGLHVLTAAPGAGKTALALQVACSCGCPALYLTAEMAPLELLRRIAARVTGEYLGRFRSGELPPERARDLFEQAAASAPMLAILDATTAPVAPKTLPDFAQASRRLAAENPHLLLVVDSVHAWARGWKAEAAEYDALNFALAELREVAQKLGAAVLAIGERNRANPSGGLSATAGTRVFEYGSETLLGLDREKDARPDANGVLEVKLTMEKNRNGIPGKTLELRFMGACQRFTEAGP